MVADGRRTCVRGGLGLLFRAGVVEGVVELPERVSDLVERRLHVLRPSDVAPDGDRAPAEFSDHVGGFLVRLVGDVGVHDVGALAGERERPIPLAAAPPSFWSRAS
jgi:hypothetical protein